MYRGCKVEFWSDMDKQKKRENKPHQSNYHMATVEGGNQKHHDYKQYVKQRRECIWRSRYKWLQVIKYENMKESET
jgi:hypothetical protein